MTNFARTWRPQTFESVVGQELVVRLLRNSLYSDRIFPVYVFSGQRGCGKTTLARLFAAAVNCEQLPLFRERPREVQVPCGVCVSCVAMRAAAHVDFLEVDAASHTGVDHVRSILEATTLAPQMGIKKIYLIDEVHMLSKAAFNALLKTLEEPIETVLFLLATTDLHKIPETVRSRCFQLFLTPLAHQQVIDQLAHICQQENISYEDAALDMIAAPSEGSLRDAINNLERAVVAYGRVHEDEVKILTGAVNPLLIIELLGCVAQRDVTAALQLLRDGCFAQGQVPHVWRMLSELLRMILWVQHGAEPAGFERYTHQLKGLAGILAAERVIAGIELLYEREQAMLKSTAQQGALELVVVRLCDKTVRMGAPSPQQASSFAEAMAGRAGGTSLRDKSAGQVQAVQIAEPAPSPAVQNFPESGSKQWFDLLWLEFMSKISDPLQLSIMRQGRVCPADSNQGRMVILVPQSLQILADTVEQLRIQLGERAEGKEIVIRFEAVSEQSVTARPPQPRILERPRPVQPPQQQKKDERAKPVVQDEITRKMLDIFPGKIMHEES